VLPLTTNLSKADLILSLLDNILRELLHPRFIAARLLEHRIRFEPWRRAIHPDKKFLW
jgi:hypothetical protein